jgi:hypothetical protein
MRHSFATLAAGRVHRRAALRKHYRSCYREEEPLQARNRRASRFPIGAAFAAAFAVTAMVGSALAATA